MTFPIHTPARVFLLAAIVTLTAALAGVGMLQLLWHLRGQPVDPASLTVVITVVVVTSGPLSLLLGEGIRRLHVAEAEVEGLARVDALTGVLRRELVLERALDHMRLSHRYGQELAIVIVDLTCMRSVNAMFGHRAGDEVLVAVAQRLQRLLRTTDLVGRIEGSAFLVVAPGTDTDNAVLLATRLREALINEAVESPVGDIQLEVSLGTSNADHRDKRLEDLMARADMARTEAREAGNNAVRQVRVVREERRAL